MADSEWLTTSFFQSCLQSQEEQPIVVTKVEASSAVQAGNNYGSQIFRVIVDYTKSDIQSSISLIIKIPVEKVDSLIGDVYEKEHKFYTKLIEATYNYCKHDIVPKHYTPPNPRFVVLEDLKTSGYVMVDRRSFLDLDHCQLFIKSSAKLHALSWAVYKESPGIIESLAHQTTAYSENNNKMMKGSLGKGLQCMAAYLKDKSDCSEYLEVIEEALKDDKYWKMCQETENLTSNKTLKALVQLDPWSTNMMFKYNTDGKVESVKKLDYQYTAFTSPLKEIVLFLSLCPTLEVRKNNLNYLYQLYCYSLNSNLAELNCSERLNFEDMKNDILEMSSLIMFVICCYVPPILSDQHPDLDEIFSDDFLDVPITTTTIFKQYQGERFCKIYPEILHLAAKDRVFDHVKEKMQRMT